ncbi:hypothetical protein DIPPA_10001 [Diplonema papillatum]|nr:hypothetical protein DIPPA_10001 [Diplonema papillatum]
MLRGTRAVRAVNFKKMLRDSVRRERGTNKRLPEAEARARLGVSDDCTNPFSLFLVEFMRDHASATVDAVFMQRALRQWDSQTCSRAAAIEKAVGTRKALAGTIEVSDKANEFVLASKALFDAGYITHREDSAQRTELEAERRLRLSSRAARPADA